jgi:hypothetical protein
MLPSLKSFSSNTSTALPHESMFVNHTINLTHNTGLEAGDTAIFRFRLASDNSVNGFGWAIDNLEIQEFQDDEESFLPKAVSFCILIRLKITCLLNGLNKGKQTS